MLRKSNVLIYMLACSLIAGCSGDGNVAKLEPNLEDKMSDGSMFTPATISILRKYHWLDSVKSVEIEVNDNKDIGRLKLSDAENKHSLSFVDVPLAQLVPRLYYTPASPADDFDRINLMLAEYSRNGLSFPGGESQDDFPRFETTLNEKVPWKLEEDYQFSPNPVYRPIRMSVTNNCLVPGLWEISGTDGAGEIYHAWYDFPKSTYYELVASASDLNVDFVEDALDWSTKTAPLDLDRLRSMKEAHGTFPLKIKDGAIGYSSQSSRKKLQKGFVRINKDDDIQAPATRSDFYEYELVMPHFVSPGIYSMGTHKKFKLNYLGEANSVDINTVAPQTFYFADKLDAIDQREKRHLEFVLDLGDKKLFMGNLPISLLVQQEEFGIYGFGVGVLKAEDFVERRKLLFESGYHPSYAYLVEEQNGEHRVLNSHEYGIEQIFIRAIPFGANPHWEVTVTSFERIVDLAKYQVPIPDTLLEEVKQYGRDYVSPLYFSYRDDNVR